MPDDPQDFRIDTFDRLWFSAIFVTAFAGFGLLFGAVAWALSNDVDLFIIGERAFCLDCCRGAGDRHRRTLEYRRALRRRHAHRGHRAGGARNPAHRAGGGDAARRQRERRNVERVSYAPVLRFTTGDGREIEFHGRSGGDRGFTSGDRVTVVYDRANPIRASIVFFLDLWLPSAVAFGVAVLFGGPVLLSRWSRRRAG